ncbi:MAG: hypothetical protein WB919_12160 [Candidatus Sulfotelmatobacter sp.]
MHTGLKLTGLLIAGALCLPAAGQADTQTTQTTTHHVHGKKKAAPLPPPLPSGTRGPVPQIPLDSIPAVAPEVTYHNGLLTIVAPNSTLADILRSVHKNTSAEIEIPPNATERVATHLGPAPAREVIADLLNGSRFNYVLLGSPTDSNALVRIVLVAKTPEVQSPQAAQAANRAPNAQAAMEAAEAEEDNTPDETVDQSATAAAEAEPASGDQPVGKTPQQMLQEMQQRVLQQQQQQANQSGAPAAPAMPAPHQPQQEQ